MMRDLQADLELCQRATPGPWFAYRTASGQVTVQCPPGWICTMSDKGDMPTARFIAAAREGWPEAIRRAMVAEQGMEEAEARLVADELEALDFLWQEYVQADPATLTEDAKELAAKVRQKVRELAGVEQLEARLAAIEAQAAQMREVLEEALPAGESGWWCPTCKCEVPDVEVTFEGYHDACGTYIETINSGAWRERARAALASDAGRETTDREEG